MSIEQEIYNAYKNSGGGKSPEGAEASATSDSQAAPTETQPEQVNAAAANNEAANTAPEFDLSDFNSKIGQHFGYEAKSADDLKSLFELRTKYSDLENQFKTAAQEKESIQTEFSSAKEKFESVGKYVDIKSYFANEELFKTNQMLLKYPDKDASIMAKISSINLAEPSTDVSKNMDLLVLKERLDSPEVYAEMTDEDVREIIASNMNIDLDDMESLDKVAKAKLLKEAKNAREEFLGYQNVELPDKVDIDKLRTDWVAAEATKFESAKKTAETVVSKMVSDFGSKELSIKDSEGKELLSFKVTPNEDFNRQLSIYVEGLARQDIDFSDEGNVAEIYEQIHRIAAAQFLPEILQANSKRVATESYDHYHNKIHNDAPLSSQQQVNTGSAQKTQEWMTKINKYI